MAKVIGYREAMVLPTQPKSMIVVGSGAIGVEFAYFYNAMGTKLPSLNLCQGWCPWKMKKYPKSWKSSLKKQGIDIMTNASVESVDGSGTGVKALVKKQDGSTVTLEADIVLSAVGVIANIENIGLEENGIKQKKGELLPINTCKQMCLASSPLVIARQTRPWRIKPARKASMRLNTSATSKRNSITSRKASTMATCRVAHTVFPKWLVLA